MREVAVLGVGQSTFGKMPEVSAAELGRDAVLAAIKDAGISAKVMIGGAPVTQDYADRIGADGYSADAASAVDTAKSLVG